MRKIIGVLLILIALSMTVATVAADGNYTGKINYSYSGKQVAFEPYGYIAAYYMVFIENPLYSPVPYWIDYHILRVQINSFNTKFSKSISLSKIRDIYLSQTVSSERIPYLVCVKNYHGGDIDIKFDKSSKIHGNKLTVTYDGKTAVADESNREVILR